jgi:ketosteroid isomerase-like protein
MHKNLIRTFAGAAAIGLAACAPSPAEVTQQYTTAVNGKNTEAAVALVSPEAAGELKAVTQDLVAKATKLDVTLPFKVEGTRVTAAAKVTNDEYTKLGVGALDATVEAAAVKGKLTAFKVALSADAQARVAAAFAAATKKVVDDFDAAVNAKNLDAALALFAENATVTCVEGPTYAGKEAIKRHLQEEAAKNTSFDKVERTVAGGKVTWVAKIANDEIKKVNAAPLDADASANIENGKITGLNLTLTADAKSKLEQAVAAAAPKKGGKKK